MHQKIVASTVNPSLASCQKSFPVKLRLCFTIYTNPKFVSHFRSFFSYERDVSWFWRKCTLVQGCQIISDQKLPIWVFFEGPWNGKCYVFWSLVIFYNHRVYLIGIWYIFRPLWYIVPKKIWQPCVWSCFPQSFQAIYVTRFSTNHSRLDGGF
jgi:hypothetical protein